MQIMEMTLTQQCTQCTYHSFISGELWTHVWSEGDECSLVAHCVTGRGMRQQARNDIILSLTGNFPFNGTYF